MKKANTKKTILTEEEVRHIARLANLSLTGEEIKKFQKQLSETLNYVEVLNELTTDEVQQTSQVTGLENVNRDEKIKPSLSQKEALSGSSVVQDGFFKTKGVWGK